MRTQRPRRPVVLVSLLLSAGLAMALGLIIYVAVTSLPYLAVSPTTDPTFGALDACALERLPERTGYAVSRELTHLAAWSSEQLLECRGAGLVRLEPFSGITAGAFDAQGGLWLAREGSDVASPGLVLLRPDGSRRDFPTISAQAVTGTRDGVIVLEPSGLLVALGTSGDVRGSYQLPRGDVRGAQLSSSGDGTRVSLITGGGLFAFTSELSLLRAEAPCEVRTSWWRAGSHAVLLECASELAIDLEVDSGRSDAAPRRARVHSVLAGPQPIWVQSCDVLPCTAAPP